MQKKEKRKERNPMDTGAWRATGCGITKSWAHLSD